MDDRVPGKAQPRSERYECPVCHMQTYSEAQPECRKHGVPMKLVLPPAEVSPPA